jgi:hypothetical protein
MQFYILMVDYGRDTQKTPHGLEAVVLPELTRREIVEQARDILSRGRNEVAFVKFVDGNFITDCTAEILEEAEQGLLEAAE